ncbi:MAG: ROK family protein [Candidatus Nanopelagicales bacterium]
MTSLSGVTQDEVRRHNLARLLQILHLHGPATRSRLGAETGLNRSTVGVLTSELADAGLVRETTPVGRGVGRPSIVVEPVATSAYVLAFDFRVERTVAALVGLGGTVLARRERVHRRDSFGERDALRHLGALARSLTKQAPADGVCAGIGVGVPGVVRHRDGLVRFAPNLGWVDVPLGRHLTELIAHGLPVVVGNDADFGAVAEHVRGAAVGSDNVIYLSGEVGVGGGIILDGAPMTGSGGYGGEVGHMVVNPKGLVCRCGARGCWETEIGEDAVLRATGLDDGEHDVLDALAAARTGDRKARAGLRRIGEWIGIGVANLVNLFNPEVVIFGGVLRDIFAETEDEVRAAMTTALSAPREQVRLALPELGGDSTLLGAAEQAFGALLADPLGGLARARAAAS